MLLRRVMKHVKDQNWTTVALDFMIVVVGVFIGIQVSNWNDVRPFDGCSISFFRMVRKNFSMRLPVVCNCENRLPRL